MNRRLARWLISLYPPRWRRRYANEFVAFLEDHPQTLSNIFNVMGSAALEHVCGAGGSHMNPRQKTLVLMACAYLAAVAAGVNFYWSVDDTPLAVAMRTHRPLSMSFDAVALGSLAAFVAVVAVAVPVTMSIARSAATARQWKMLGRIGTPFASAFIVIVWLAASSIVTGRHWVATPWDVTGGWPAPADWPALSIRWTMSSVTFVLLLSGLIGSAVAASAVIRASDFSRYRSWWFTITSIALAVSMVGTTAGVAGWGWFAQQYAAADFHARNGGLFNSANMTSWAASLAVFVAASALAVRGAAASCADVLRARD